MENKVKYNFRMSKELRDKLVKRAKEEARTQTQIIERSLEKELKRVYKFNNKLCQQ